MFTMRFDMRTPPMGAPTTDLYQAAVEMAAAVDTQGCVAIILSEHHGIEDGYLPTPVLLATAMAARTQHVHLSIAVVLLPLHDALRVAEEMLVLDHISRGRVSFAFGVGYRIEEYEMLGVDFHRRGRLADEKLAVVLQAKTGEAFEHDGRTIKLTPAPFTPGGPMVAWGGGTEAAARRAGRFGVGLFAERGDPALAEAYAQACAEAGHEPGMCVLPPEDLTTTLFVADDLDAAWAELGPYLMHDVLSYQAWNAGLPAKTSMSQAATAEQLRAEDRSHRIVTVDEAVELVRSGQMLALHPLIGGLPPEIAWRYLRTVTDVVMPALAG